MKKLSKKKIFTVVMTIILTVLMFSLFSYYKNHQPNTVTFSMDILSDNVDSYKVYYDLDGSMQWSEKNCSTNNYSTTAKKDDLKFVIPSEVRNIRIDFGNSPKNIEVSNMFFKKNGKSYLKYDEIKNHMTDKKEINITSEEDDALNVETDGNDSYIVLNNIQNIVDPVLKENKLIDCGLIVLSLILGYIMSKSLLEFKNSINFIKVCIQNKSIIKALSKNDFKSKYASSYLGIIWGFIQPLITICVYWFVFQVGFRSGSVGDVPFIIWFICGIIPWFFFSEALPSASNAFIEYSYLVKKVVFKIEILPAVKIVSALFVHVFFILFLFIVMIAYKRLPDIYSLQFIYYSIAMMVLVFSLSIFTSAVMLFFRDLGQMIGIIISVGFWATPIGWSVRILPDNIARLFKLNPMYYIVTGYRDSFIDKIFLWQRPYEALYFWLFCIVTFFIGVKMYNRLKPHFSDVI